jgi:flagellar hook-associated protein 3 FlgL
VRITSEVMVARSTHRLHHRLQAYERSQSELATGRRLLRPSDDPSGARRALSIRAALRSREQEVQNASDATGWLDQADAELQTAIGRLGRARELAVAGASLQTPGSSQAMAVEVRNIAEELIGIANSRHNGRPLFGGFASGDALQVAAGPPVVTTFIPPPGSPEEVRRRVSDTEHVRVNVTAAEWLGAGSADGDLISYLYGLASELEAGDQQAVGARLSGLTRAADTIAGSLAHIGAASNRVDSARARAMEAQLTLRTELSNVEDVDIAAGIMELQVQQVAYEATLQALAKALPPSLVAFLR